MSNARRRDRIAIKDKKTGVSFSPAPVFPKGNTLNGGFFASEKCYKSYFSKLFAPFLYESAVSPAPEIIPINKITSFAAR